MQVQNYIANSDVIIQTKKSQLNTVKFVSVNKQSLLSAKRILFYWSVHDDPVDSNHFSFKS